MNEHRKKQFFRTAFLRHQIYVLKELGIPKPWTDNIIFQSYRFCNVFRYLDKTSVWIIENAIKPNEDNPELWKTIIMCRYISRIDTLKILKEGDCLIGNQLKAYRFLRLMQNQKQKIFTNAFIVNSKVPGGWSDKVTYLFTLINEIQKNLDFDPDLYYYKRRYMKDLYNHFYLLPGVANFMAYQYTVDFTYSERYLKKAEDKNTWVSLGLGAVRGMNRLLSGEASRDKIPNANELACELLGEWREYIYDHLQEWIKSTQHKSNKEGSLPDLIIIDMFEPFKYVDLRDVQHWLCEYDKYCRGGSKKRRYPGKE